MLQILVRASANQKLEYGLIGDIEGRQGKAALVARRLSLPLPLLLVFLKYCLQFVVCATILLQEVGKVASTLNRLPVRLVAVQMKVIPLW